jgi:cation transport protein ChaC
MLRRALQEWGGASDLWVFAYASLIWRPDFDVAEQRHGAGTRLAPRPEDVEPHQPRHTRNAGPGVRAAVRRQLPGRRAAGAAARRRRRCCTSCGSARWSPASTTRAGCAARPPPARCGRWVSRCRAPAPTTPASSARERYRQIFAHARGRYGTTLDYADQTLRCLQQHGIHDAALHRLLHHATRPETPALRAGPSRLPILGPWTTSPTCARATSAPNSAKTPRQADPLQQFSQWLDEAIRARSPSPTQ